MNTIFPLIIAALSGATASNFTGLALRKFSLGYIRNTVVGIIGGLVVGLAESAGNFSSLDTVLDGVVWGGAGGGVLLLVCGAIRNLVKKQ